MYSYFLKRGYAVVRVDIRGTGNSEGVTIPYEYSDIELDDGEVVIQWLADQDWSTGKVGMFGISWGGFNSIQMAMRNPLALKAFVAIMATEALYQEDVHYMDGIMHTDSWMMSHDLYATLPGAPDYVLDDEWAENRFDREIVPVEAPVLDKEGNPTGETATISRDEGLRATTMDSLAGLDPVPGQEFHTAGTSSQVSDGAAVVILANQNAVDKYGLKPRAKIISSTLVGVDPVTMLKGPIPATEKVLKQTDLSIDDVDVFEVNEAFASVVLGWQKAVGADINKVNPNGGAIALGHPTGSTGARLITTALHELERSEGKYALIAMCCGGGLGTGTLIERV